MHIARLLLPDYVVGGCFKAKYGLATLPALPEEFSITQGV